MAARESSCSSRNIVPDVPTLPLGGRIGRGNVHERHASVSDGSNTPPAAVLKSHSILPCNAALAIKLNSTLPRNASSTPIIQSSWIQRLKPFSQTCILEKEPAALSLAKKENPVCTHFTKDFRSCSRRLNKSSHHMRSSSWPPHGAWFEGEGHTSREPGEAADITEGYDKAAVNPPDLGHQNIGFASKNITYSIDAGSGTGNRFVQQQNTCKQISAIEGFVPGARNREISSLEKLNDFQGSKNGDERELKNHIAQQFANRIKHVKKADSVAACDVSQQMKPFIQPEEVCNKWDYYNDASASVNIDVLSVCGATADAHDRKFFVKPLNFCMIKKKELLQTPLSKTDCEIAFPTDRFGEDRPFRREVGRNGLVMGSEDAEDPGRRNFKQFKETAEISQLFDGISNVRSSRKFDLSHRNHHLADAFNTVREGDVITACAVNSSTVPTPATLKQEAGSRKLDAFCNLANPHLSEGGRIRRSSLAIGSLNEDTASFTEAHACRSRIREISLGEYWDSWVRELEEPDHVRPEEKNRSTASLHQDFAVGEYKKNLFQLPSRKLRFDAMQKHEDHHSCSPHKLAKDDAENLGSCDFPQPMLALSSNNYHKFSGHWISSNQTKTGQDQELCASADRISHFRSKCPQDSEGEELCFSKGTTGRVGSQSHNEDPGLHRMVLDNGGSHSRMHSTHPSHEYCNNEGTGKGCSMQQAWIQRWQFSAGKASAFLPGLSRGSSSDQLMKLPESCSASAQCTLASSHRAMDSFGLNSGRGSNRCTEASGTHLDSCSASTPGSLPAVRNFAAFRSGYRVPCIKGVAVVCKSASKLHPTSLQNRGFCGLPCSGPKSLKCKDIPEDVQGTIDKKRHSVDLDDLKDSKRHMDDS